MNATANNAALVGRQEVTGEVPSYREAKLGPRFAKLVMERQELKSVIKDLEEKADWTGEALLEELAGTGFKGVMVDSYHVQIVDQTRTSLSKEKLLELGVPASVILSATVESNSTYLKVTDTDKGRTTRKEKKAGVTAIKKPAKKAKKGKR